MDTSVESPLTDICDMLFDISNRLILFKKPFENLLLNEAIVSISYLYYHRYLNDINDTQRRVLLDYYIAFSRYLIMESLFGNQIAFIKQYPELSKSNDSFLKYHWDLNKPQVNKPIVFAYNKPEKVDFKKTIQELIKKEYPDYCQYRKKVKRGAIAFKKKISNQSSFIVAFCKGKNRTFFNVEIGLDNPKFLLDIGCFFARPQSMFDYCNIEQAQSGFCSAFEYVESICSFIQKFIYQN